MSKIDEKQAESILSYLTIRFLKSMNVKAYAKFDLSTHNVIKYSDSLVIATTSKRNIFSMPVFLLFIQNHESKVQKMLSIGTHTLYTNILEILLQWTSIGYDILATTHIFLPAYITLEQILIEKDLEENMVA